MELDGGRVSFQCSEIHPDCEWQICGNSDAEILPEIEKHRREKHGLQDFGEDEQRRVRRSIHPSLDPAT